jgi:hypothetical protein
MELGAAPIPSTFRLQSPSDFDARSRLSPKFYRTAANVRLGILRCVFPNAESAADIEMKRLLSVFGDQIIIEIEPRRLSSTVFYRGHQPQQHEDTQNYDNRG